MLGLYKKLMVLIAGLFLMVNFVKAEMLLVDPAHSEVGFSIKHMMISNVSGQFNKYDAEINYDTKLKKFNSVKAVIETKSIDTGIEKRDDHLRSPDFFESSKYPNIVFMMTKYTADGDEGVMEGDITIRGITKKIKLDVEVNGIVKDFEGNTRVGFTLTGKLNRKDFGLLWNKALEFGGFAVGDKVKLLIELETVAK